MNESVLKKLAKPMLILAPIIWGSSFVVMKHSLDSFTPFYLLAFRFTAAAIVLGLVLGSMFEGEFRRALKLSHGSMTIFFKRPVSCVFILIGLAVIGNACLKAWKKKPET